MARLARIETQVEALLSDPDSGHSQATFIEIVEDEYLGQTDQVTSRQLASSTLATTWSYLNNTGDRRFSGIANVGLTAGQFSTFAFTSAPEDFGASITETAAVYSSLSCLKRVSSGQGLLDDDGGGRGSG